MKLYPFCSLYRGTVPPKWKTPTAEFLGEVYVLKPPCTQVGAGAVVMFACEPRFIALSINGGRRQIVEVERG